MIEIKNGISLGSFFIASIYIDGIAMNTVYVAMIVEGIDATLIPLNPRVNLCL